MSEDDNNSDYFNQRAEFYEPSEEEKLREWGMFDGEVTREEDYAVFWRAYKEAQGDATGREVLDGNDKQSNTCGGGYASSVDYKRRVAEGKRRGWNRPYPSK